MPIFEYKCSTCGDIFEELVAKTPLLPLPCPSCKSKETIKIMSAAGISVRAHKDPACVSSCGSGHSCPSGRGGCHMM